MEKQIPPTPFKEGGASSIPSLQNEKITFSSGTHRTSILSPASGRSGPAAVFTRVFRCRKKGFDYLGQVQIQHDGPKFQMEIFNENYFSHFESGKNDVLDSLKVVVLRRLMKEGDLPSGYKTLILSFLESEIRPPVETFSARQGERNNNGFDLQEMFDHLNAQYFENKIQAGVGWGRDSKKTNRSAFRFGSYDRAKKLIRIHPRLNQEFVPFPVVELTVYHEMCHQWAPSVKRNGVWRDHHPEFKKKEKEYRFYQEARGWEKQNWKKFLKPIPEK